MARENVVRITILTACIFAFGIYWQKGTWVFPFPLYETAMVIAIISLLIADKKRPSSLGLLALTWSLLQLLASDFILEFIVSEKNIDWFLESAYLDILQLISWGVFLLWGIWAMSRFKNVSLLATGIVTLLGFLSLVLTNNLILATIPLTICLLVFFTERKEATLERQILLLFTFFFLSKYLTIFFMVK